MTDLLSAVTPTKRAGLLFQLFGQSARATARTHGKSMSWLSNYFQGVNKWTPRIEAIVFVELDGNHEQTAMIRQAAIGAWEHRQSQVAK